MVIPRTNWIGEKHSQEDRWLAFNRHTWCVDTQDFPFFFSLSLTS